MARLVGIDIRATRARVAILQSRYRGYQLVDFRQVELTTSNNRDEELHELLNSVVQAGDHIACCMSGAHAFVRELQIPTAAAKQLSEVVPYEIEAQVPVDIEDLCFDYRLLRRKEGGKFLAVLAVAARVDVVQEHIDCVEAATGIEPERVAAGALPLANLGVLAPDLRATGPVAVLDLGISSSDFVVLESGRPVFARTLSVGAGAGADSLISSLRQSRAAWLRGSSEPLAQLYLAGDGASVEGACPVLTEALGLEVSPLPRLGLDGWQGADGALAGYEKAIGTALGVASGGQDLNLRQGALSYQQSYEFLKTKAPVLGAVVATIFLSFAFLIWARSRALTAENAALAAELATITEQAIGEKISSPQVALDTLDRGGNAAEKDPQPLMDAFAVLAAVSEKIDGEIVHDIEEFEAKGDKVKLVGVVSTTRESEKIAAALEAHSCFKEVKIAKNTKVVGSDRWKYSMSFAVDCESTQAVVAAAGGQ